MDEEELKNIFAYIEEKAEHRGWENAEHFAINKWGEEKVEEALKFVKNKNQL